MTDTNEWTEPGYLDQEPNGNLVHDLRNQLKAKADAEKKMAEENEKLRTQVRSNAIDKVLSDRGVPSKVAAFVPASIEPTAEAVAKWLDENSEVFNIPKGEAQAQPATVVPPETVDAIKTMQDVSASAETPSIGGPVTVDDLNGAKSLDELRALIARGG